MSGCGQHLETTFKEVKMEERCWCGYGAADLEAAKSAAKASATPTAGPFPKGAAACAAAVAAKAAAAGGAAAAAGK